MRVLLVEDDAGLGESMSHALREIARADVEWVRTATRAITIIEAEHEELDAVVSDYDLNDAEDGVGVLRAAFRWGVRPTVLMSGSVHVIEVFRDHEVVDHALLKGPDAVRHVIAILRGGENGV